MDEICETISFKMSNSEDIVVNFTKDFTKEDWLHITLTGLDFKDGKLKIANPDGYILTASMMGKTPEEAGEKLEKLFDKIKVPKSFYRNDFGKSNYHKAKDDLIKWGYILPESEKLTVFKKKKEKGLENKSELNSKNSYEQEKSVRTVR